MNAAAVPQMRLLALLPFVMVQQSLTAELAFLGRRTRAELVFLCDSDGLVRASWMRWHQQFDIERLAGLVASQWAAAAHESPLHVGNTQIITGEFPDHQVIVRAVTSSMLLVIVADTYSPLAHIRIEINYTVDRLEILHHG